MALRSSQDSDTVKNAFMGMPILFFYQFLYYYFSRSRFDFHFLVSVLDLFLVSTVHVFLGTQHLKFILSLCLSFVQPLLSDQSLLCL